MKMIDAESVKMFLNMSWNVFVRTHLYCSHYTGLQSHGMTMCYIQGRHYMTFDSLE